MPTRWLELTLWLVAIAALAAGMRVCARPLRIDDVQWPSGLVDDRATLGAAFHTVSVPAEPWVLVLGGSSAYHGIDPDALGWPSRKQTHPRGYATDMALTLDWTLRRTLPPEQRPKAVVWAVSAASFVDRRGGTIHPCATPVATGRRSPALADRLGLCDDTVGQIGLIDRARLAWIDIDPWYGARAATQDLLATNLAARWGRPTPGPDPEDYGEYVGRNDAKRRALIQAWEDLGVFRSGNLHAPQVQAVKEIARSCDAAGVPLLIVDMPEHSETRAKYTPEARAEFVALLRQPGVAVLDLFEALPDEGFYDQAHANEIGRQEISARIAEAL